MNARITFGNIFATGESVPGVTTLDADCDPPRCMVDESCFEPPADYLVIGGDGDDLHDSNGFDDEDYAHYSDAWEQYFNRGGNGNGGPRNGQPTNGDETIGTDRVTFLEAIKTNQTDMDPDLQR